MSTAAVRADPLERGVRAGGSARVLLIEDDHGFSEVVSRALRAHGFESVLAEGGAQALGRLRSEKYDVVLLDLLLPDIDGLSLLRRLIGSQPALQVIVVSALSSVEAKVRCLDLGASDYLAKPFALNELVARVRARARAGASSSWDGYVRDPSVVLDLQRHLAIVDGRVVPLSGTEFRLLEYLMRRTGEVCSRAELLRNVWEYTFDPGTNVVDVYVRRVRRKLGGSLIETVRNVGYSFVGS